MHKLLDALIHLDRRPNIVLRFVDRYLGIPMVALLRVMHRKREQTLAPVGSIGILGNSAIGDTIVLSAAVLDIRAQFPSARLVVFAPGADCETVCGMIDGIDQVVQVRMSRPVETVRAIRRCGPFDLWFDCAPWARTNAVVSWFVPGALRIGFATRGQHRHGLYDVAVEHGDQVHEVENYRRLLAAAGIPGSHIPTVHPPQGQPAERRVVMHVVSGGTAAALKMWPEPHWAALIDEVTRRGIPVVLTGSRQDRAALETLRSRCRTPDLVQNAAGQLSLARTAELLAASLAVVSVDTGIMHLAAALDCRLLALFGATSPRRWGPLNGRAKALSSARDCSPCVSLGLEAGCASNLCMRELTPLAVLQELEALIAAR